VEFHDVAFLALCICARWGPPAPEDAAMAFSLKRDELSHFFHGGGAGPCLLAVILCWPFRTLPAKFHTGHGKFLKLAGCKVLILQPALAHLLRCPLAAIPLSSCGKR
jgi:hypothetical protein